MRILLLLEIFICVSRINSRKEGKEIKTFYICNRFGGGGGGYSFRSRKTLYIPHHSLIIPLRVLSKYMFPVIIYFSNLESDPYSLYRKNLIAALKIREKKLISHRTPLRENDDLSISRAKPPLVYVTITA